MNKARILIVDDEKININVLMGALKAEYIIQAAQNGKQALKRAAELSPDLILLDIVMPEMDGYEVCKKLKSDDKTRHIPIIFLTAISDSCSETKGLELGAVDYITKPINVSIVKTRLKHHLEREKLIRDLKEALDNIKKLSGLLPICAHCKNIRDDKGYWNQIETYIESHSDAMFSHGLCPQCGEELYGDQEWFKKKNR